MKAIKMGRIIDGRKISSQVREEVNSEVLKLKSRGISIGLATVMVGADPASEIYVGMKHKACERAGIYSKNYRLDENTSEDKLIALVEKLNHDDAVHGILVQLPLPGHIDRNKAMAAISPEKDVDGFHPVNMGKLLIGEELLVPCTPKGIIRMLDYEEVDLEGKDTVIINHSPVVGKPLALMFLNRDATVTVCHVKTKDVKRYSRDAEILVVAAGVPNLIKEDMVGENSVVIDVGINRVDGKIVGDVDFNDVKNRASLITPVPGGTGPMTIAMLLENTLIAAKMQLNL
ncbi:MAG: bifunctional 5,10-methylene-tetrahydrofolate dehydrogenase/5,10-methylene-tetrahydrofolate cyclohydrolase [Candidatus Altiarchaeales archaeon]|nr:bifunctional 5,10-methylene-tetrahydrofolate dehydrogenase/5,10-methylene-tetrahydrofolate cyclohydrolase [Candidatus Altiarchaeales archaeon]